MLTDELSWRGIFFLNLPVAAFAVLMTARFVHQPPVEVTERRIDYAGIATVSRRAGRAAARARPGSRLGLDRRPRAGDVRARRVLLVAFAAIERRVGEAALIPADVISNRRFRAACLTVLMISAVFFSIVLYVPQLMEKILDWSALKAGVRDAADARPVRGRRVRRRPPLRADRRPAGDHRAAPPAWPPGRCCCRSSGPTPGYAALVPGLAVTGIGAGLFYPSITTAAVTMLDQARSSLAGGITYMFQIAGGAIGLGLTTALFTSRSEDEVVSDAAELGLQMTGEQAAVIHGVLAGTEPGQRRSTSSTRRSPSGSSTWSRNRSSPESSSASAWSR